MKKVISAILSLTLLLGCLAGITLFAVADAAYYVDYSTGTAQVDGTFVNLALDNYYTVKDLGDGTFAAAERGNDFTYWCLRFNTAPAQYSDKTYRSTYRFTITYYDPGTVTSPLTLQYRTEADDNVALSLSYTVDKNATAETAGWRTKTFVLTDAHLENNRYLSWYSCRFCVANNADCGYMIKRVEIEPLDYYKDPLNELLANLPDVSEDDYDPDDWAAYTRALQTARTVAADTAVRQPAIDSALKDLQNAISTLTGAGFFKYYVDYSTGTAQVDGTFVNLALDNYYVMKELDDGTFAAAEKAGEYTYWPIRFNTAPAQYPDKTYRTAYRFKITYYDPGTVTTPLTLQYRTATDTTGLSLSYTVDKNTTAETAGWRTKTFTLTDAHLENNNYLAWYSCRFCVANNADCGYMIKRIDIEPLDFCKDTLKSLLANLPDIQEGDCDPDEWAAYTRALQTARTVMADTTVHQPAVDSAVQDLQHAIRTLTGVEFSKLDFSSGAVEYDARKLVSATVNGNFVKQADDSYALVPKASGTFLTLNLSAFCDEKGNAATVFVRYRAAADCEGLTVGISSTNSISQNRYLSKMPDYDNVKNWVGEPVADRWAYAVFTFDGIASSPYNGKLTLSSPGKIAIAEIGICAPDERQYVARTLQADLSGYEAAVPTVFGNNMIFQQNKPMNLWGSGVPGSKARAVLLQDGTVIETADAITDENGKWSLSFAAREGGYQSYSVHIFNNDVAITAFRNILIGELWLAGGQSNMELRLNQDYELEDILYDLGNSTMRMFVMVGRPQGTTTYPKEPCADIPGGFWSTGSNVSNASPYSSLAYQFAAKLEKTLEVPVGIIDTSLGATTIETWLPREAVDADPAVKATLQDHGLYPGEKTTWETNTLSVMYNSKVAPLAGMNIAGTIWYQGESNSNEAEYYDVELDLLKRSWGKAFGFADGDMPLIFTQVAPYYAGNNLQKYGWLSESMTNAWRMSEQKDTAMLTIYDLPLYHMRGGESSDPIHPRMKRPVAERFVASALNMVYGGTGEYTAPVYRDMSIQDSSILLTFDRVGDGLKVIGGGTALHGFAIAGEDGVFVNAEAAIVGKDTVKVWNNRVPAPKYVTYAFDNLNQGANLANSSDIPAAPFRTMAVGDTCKSPDSSFTYFPAQDWMNCEKDVWVYDPAFTAESCVGFRPAFSLSQFASYSYQKGICAEGDASLRIDYLEDCTVQPILSYNSIKTDYKRFPYFSFSVLNAGKTDATVTLTIHAGIRNYTIPLESGETSALIPAGGTAFTQLTFCPGKVAMSGNITSITVGISSERGGTVLLDKFMVGTGAAVLSDEEINRAAPSVMKSKEDLQALIAEKVCLASADEEIKTEYEDALLYARERLLPENCTAFSITVAYIRLTDAIAALSGNALTGDVDGDGNITSTDARLTLQYYAKKIGDDALNTAVADVDGDGDITSTDARLILQYYARKIDVFPVDL